MGILKELTVDSNFYPGKALPLDASVKIGSGKSSVGMLRGVGCTGPGELAVITCIKNLIYPHLDAAETQAQNSRQCHAT
jgi:hypothetical protein